MKGFKKDGKFRPTGNRKKSSLTTENVKFKKPMSFEDREFLIQIMRDKAKIRLIHKGRQLEISEMLVNDALMFGWQYPETSIMYISDIASHAYTFSNDRVRDNAIKNSEVMQKIANPKNHTTQK